MPLRVSPAKLTLALGVAFAASVASAQSDQAAVKSMFERQVSALNRGDTATYLTTIDPKGPSYSQIKTMIGSLLKSYKLSVKLESIKVLSVKGNSAQVSMSIATRKISGPAFQDNRTVMLCSAARRDGKWYSTQTKVNKFEALK